MNKNIYKEIVVVGLLLVLGFVCNSYSMEIAMYNSLHVILVALFALLSIIIWRAKSQDERDRHQRAMSSDIGFTGAGIILSIGIVAQIYTQGSIDIWLLLTLVGMSFIRVVARIWLEKNR